MNAILSRLKERPDAEKQSNAAYYSVTGFLTLAVLLAIFSWMNICTKECAEGHNYRLFGLRFEIFGLTLFPLFTLMHVVSRRFAPLATLTAWCLCSALGAEVFFIYVQKYKIGHWCPVCLSIAATLLAASSIYFYEYCSYFKKMIQNRQTENIMINIFKAGIGTLAFVIGFTLALTGTALQNELQAEENSLKDKISFGNLNSPVEVLIFTDWECPACRSLEPTFEALMPLINQKAKVTFVDDAVHPATLNYTPYNLAFMINNKANYMALRHALTALSEETKTPSDQQITELAAKQGVRFTELHYADVTLGTKYFNELIDQYKVEGTPTVVIFDKQHNRTKKLEGTMEISKDNIVKAVDDFSKI